MHNWRKSAAPTKPRARRSVKKTEHPGATTPGWEKLRVLADDIAETWDAGMPDMDTSKACKKCWETRVLVVNACGHSHFCAPCLGKRLNCPLCKKRK